MWFSFKKSLASSGLLNGFTDWHSHLLPGVDDGVQEMDETLSILEEYERQGVKQVWFTPHVMEDVPNHPADLQKRFEEVKKQWTGAVNISLASEHMLDNIFDARLSKGEVMPIGSDARHLLVETSYFTPPYDLEGKLEAVKKAGYFPLLAHPERYVYMDMRQYDQLLGQGVRFQLNIYSLFGMYGPEARDKAARLLKKGAYSAIGTDTHRYRQLAFALRHKALSKSEVQSLEKIALI